MGNIDPQMFIISLTVIILALSFHEYGHAKFADLAGDPTPRYYGRVTLNPLAHLDPVGTIMIILSSLAGFGIGWGKPVLVDPRKMRNPRWDHFASVAAGPMMNLLQAGVYAILWRLMIMNTGSIGSIIDGGPLMIFLFLGVVINMSLFFFNLIPLGPLDGHWLVGASLPERLRIRWYQFNRSIGGVFFIILILLPRDINPITSVIRPLVWRAASFLLGIPPLQ